MISQKNIHRRVILLSLSRLAAVGGTFSAFPFFLRLLIDNHGLSPQLAALGQGVIPVAGYIGSFLGGTILVKKFGSDIVSVSALLLAFCTILFASSIGAIPAVMIFIALVYGCCNNLIIHGYRMASVQTFADTAPPWVFKLSEASRVLGKSFAPALVGIFSIYSSLTVLFYFAASLYLLAGILGYLAKGDEKLRSQSTQTDIESKHETGLNRKDSFIVIGLSLCVTSLIIPQIQVFQWGSLLIKGTYIDSYFPYYFAVQGIIFIPAMLFSSLREIKNLDKVNISNSRIIKLGFGGLIFLLLGALFSMSLNNINAMIVMSLFILMYGYFHEVKLYPFLLSHLQNIFSKPSSSKAFAILSAVEISMQFITAMSSSFMYEYLKIKNNLNYFYCGGALISLFLFVTGLILIKSQEKKVLTLSSLLFLAVGFSSDTNIYRDTIVIAYGAKILPKHLSPREQDTLPARMLANLIYEPLIIVDKNNRIYPALSKKWYFNPKTNELTFFFETDKKFSDGTPVNAIQIESSIRELCINHSVDIKLIINCSSISSKDIEKKEFKVSMKLLASPDLALRFIAYGRIHIFKPSPKGDIGSGPLMIKSSDAGASFEMVPNPHFPFKSKEARLRKYKFKSIAWDNLSKHLKSSKIDFSILYDKWSFIDNKSPDNYEIFKEAADTTLALVLNSGDITLKSEEYRRYFTYLFSKNINDRKCILDSDKTSTFFPKFTFGYRQSFKPDLKVQPPPKKPELVINRSQPYTLLLLQASYDECIFASFRKAAESLGLKPKIEVLEDYNKLENRLKSGNYAAYMDYFIFGYREPYITLRKFSPESTKDYANLPHQTEFDDILNRAIRTRDLGERLALYREASAWLQTSYRIIPISVNERWQITPKGRNNNSFSPLENLYKLAVGELN